MQHSNKFIASNIQHREIANQSIECSASINSQFFIFLSFFVDIYIKLCTPIKIAVCMAQIKIKLKDLLIMPVYGNWKVCPINLSNLTCLVYFVFLAFLDEKFLILSIMLDICVIDLWTVIFKIGSLDLDDEKKSNVNFF